MARPTLQRNRKWARLVRALGGDEALARGSLELMWDVAYENGDEVLGDTVDVELAAKWRGEPGKLTQALLTAGGDGEAGFIEEVPERPGRYRIHDLWDHAPDYVRKRRQRETERRTKGAELSRSAEADRSESRQTPDDGGRAAPFGRPPAPAPAPEQLSPPAREALRAPAEIQRLVAERWPLTLELLGVLEKTCGFEASLPKDNASRSAVELAIRNATVPVAAERIRAVVEADRAAKLVTKPWLGFHLKTIQGLAESGAWRASAPARRTHGDLGVEHERWWHRLSREDCERFLAERKAIDPILDERAPFPSTGTEHIGEVTALIERFKARAFAAAAPEERRAGGCR